MHTPTDPVSPNAGRARSWSAVLVIGALGLTAMAWRERAAVSSSDGIPAPSVRVVAGTDTAPEQAPQASDVVGTFKVRDLKNQLVPVVRPGEPSVVMISSVTCTWCMRALKDLGEMAAGRPLPRLTVLTLEGARGGVRMLAKEKLTGASLVGPATDREQVLLTFRNRGTPTFVAIDRNGRVVAMMPGYPMYEVMKSWFAVMAGDAETP
jgi:hypothetical protein